MSCPDQTRTVTKVFSLSNLGVVNRTTLFTDVTLVDAGGIPIKLLTEHRIRPEPALFNNVLRSYDVTTADLAVHNRWSLSCNHNQNANG